MSTTRDINRGGRPPCTDADHHADGNGILGAEGRVGESSHLLFVKPAMPCAGCRVQASRQ